MASTVTAMTTESPLLIVGALLLAAGLGVLIGRLLVGIPVRMPPPPLSCDEVLRRILELEAQGKVVNGENIHPEWAAWVRSVPWPQRWFMGKTLQQVERNLKEPLGGPSP